MPKRHLSHCDHAINSILSDTEKGPSDMEASDAAVVLGLSELVVRRVHTSYDFRTCEQYVHRVEILVQNTGTRDCWAVPSVFYDKKVLVSFSAEDGRGGGAILTPSRRNDQILRKVLFYKCWQNATSWEQRLLYRAFVDPFADPPRRPNMEEILNKRFAGALDNKLSKSMWSDSTSTKNLLNEPLSNDVPKSTRHDAAERGNPTIARISSEEFSKFFEKLHMKFFQLIWLSNPIRPGEYCAIVVQDQRFLENARDTSDPSHAQLRRRKLGLGGSQCSIPIEFEGNTPFHSGATYHILVRPPEGVKLDFHPGRFQTYKGKGSFYSNGETVVDRTKIDFYHFTTAAPMNRVSCDNISRSLKLSATDKSKCTAIEGVSDLRTRFDDNFLMFYFTPDGEKTICDQPNHNLSFRFNLKREFARAIHWLTIILLVLTIIATSLLLPEKYAEMSSSMAVNATAATVSAPVALVDQYFWPIITLMIAQSVSVLFDYSRRPESQQHFLERTLRIIITLSVTEFLLILVGPLLLLLSIPLGIAVPVIVLLLLFLTFAL
jgi:hypothetical protein